MIVKQNYSKLVQTSKSLTPPFWWEIFRNKFYRRLPAKLKLTINSIINIIVEIDNVTYYINYWIASRNENTNLFLYFNFVSNFIQFINLI